MSKARLRKELETMDASQLRQIILDAYDARTEIKEYFEFFLNPDVEKLLEKFKKDLLKELNRSKWGLSKARVTKLKSLIKNLRGLNPGAEVVLKAQYTTLYCLGITEMQLSFPAALINYTHTIVDQILEFADENMMVEEALLKIREIIDNPLVPRWFSSRLRNKLSTIV